MRWNRRGNPVQREKVNRLRHLACQDPSTYERPMATELLNLAMDGMQRGRKDVEPLLREVVSVLQRRPQAEVNEPDMLLVTALGLLGSELIRDGRPEEAEEALSKAAAVTGGFALSSEVAAEHSTVLVSNLVAYARCREHAGAQQEARAMLEQANEILESLSQSEPVLAEQIRTGVEQMRSRLNAHPE